VDRIVQDDQDVKLDLAMIDDPETAAQSWLFLAG